MAKRNKHEKNIGNCIQRKHFKEVAVSPLKRSIEMHARRILQSQEKIWNKVQGLEDSLDILAREFLRHIEDKN